MFFIVNYILLDPFKEAFSTSHTFFIFTNFPLFYSRGQDDRILRILGQCYFKIFTNSKMLLLLYYSFSVFPNMPFNL